MLTSSSFSPLGIASRLSLLSLIENVYMGMNVYIIIVLPA